MQLFRYSVVTEQFTRQCLERMIFSGQGIVLAILNNRESLFNHKIILAPEIELCL